MTPPSTVAGIITAVAATITALGGLVLAFGVLLPILKSVRSTHQIVNSHNDKMVQVIKDLNDYNRALVRALESRGIDVPIDQSTPPEKTIDR